MEARYGAWPIAFEFSWRTVYELNVRGRIRRADWTVSGRIKLKRVINIFITLSALYQTDMMFFAHLIWTRAVCSYQGTRTLLVIGTLLVPAHPVWYEFTLKVNRNPISDRWTTYIRPLIMDTLYSACTLLGQRRVSNSSIGGNIATYEWPNALNIYRGKILHS